MYAGQFQAASANVIGQLYALKLSNGANICPKDIMRDMREKHGVELLYTKTWMAMQHARLTVYGKVDESYKFLPGYFHMLAEANPGTVTAIETDRHNGIANGMRNVYPTVPHCICYYHLKQNLKKEAPKRGDVLQLYKLAAYSYRTEDNEGKVWTVDLELRTCTCRIQEFQKNDYAVITSQLNGFKQHMHLRYTQYLILPVGSFQNMLVLALYIHLKDRVLQIPLNLRCGSFEGEHGCKKDEGEYMVSKVLLKAFSSFSSPRTSAGTVFSLSTPHSVWEPLQ
ncbi:hypothetical protein Ddye_012216 [Dipteronia dyeriana]|uniref:MULE transposase domain-containing protein n=1 Tax=Dipteronia dyeriana TaxID=168575 RepID=A0AAE0CIC3_9ROSI|nr:hypothetical protein Ddye_012216 [Dipteronia dyeriana]